MARVVLTTETKVALAAMRPEDRRLHYEIWCEETVQRNYNAPRPWSTFDEFVAWMDAPSRPRPRLTATILRLPQDEPVGIVNISAEGSEPDVAILLHADHRGQGLGTEAMRLVCDYALTRLGLPYLVAGAYEGNHASIRLLERVGFVRAAADDQDEPDRFGTGRICQLGFRYAPPPPDAIRLSIDSRRA